MDDAWPSTTRGRVVGTVFLEQWGGVPPGDIALAFCLVIAAIATSIVGSNNDGSEEQQYYSVDHWTSARLWLQSAAPVTLADDIASLEQRRAAALALSVVGGLAIGMAAMHTITTWSQTSPRIKGL